MPQEVVDEVLAVTRRNPKLSQYGVAAALRRRGVKISPSGVDLIWFRRDLTTLRQREAYRSRPHGNAPEHPRRARFVWDEEV